MPRRPLMLVVAGPAGSGKSQIFPISASGVDWFSVDDRCAELNGGSYRGIPPEVRLRAGQECAAFIRAHTDTGVSFAVETTLRTGVALEQARAARARGFFAWMIHVATADVEENVDRVTARGLAGGHSAPAERIREIYRESLANLPAAVQVFDRVSLYDNTARGVRARLVAEFRDGRLVRAGPPSPAWLSTALRRRERPAE